MAKMAAAVTYFGCCPRKGTTKKGEGGGHRWCIGAPEQNGKRLLAEARGLSAPPAIAEEKNDGEEKEESFWIKV